MYIVKVKIIRGTLVRMILSLAKLSNILKASTLLQDTILGIGTSRSFFSKQGKKKSVVGNIARLNKIYSPLTIFSL